MPDSDWPYSLLGIEAGDVDRKAVRRAYARALKKIDQFADPDGFQALREAYENALLRAQHPEWFSDGPDDDDDWVDLHDPDDNPGARTPAARADEVLAEEALGPKPDTASGDHPDADHTDPASRADEASAEEAFDQRPLEEGQLPPGPWGPIGLDARPPLADAEEDLLHQIEALADDRPQTGKWRTVLDSPVLNDIDAAMRIEQQIFRALETRIEYGEDGRITFPFFANGAWAALVDERFGWMSDLPMVRRKFGWHAEELIMPLAHMSYAYRQASRAHSAAHAAPSKSRLWAQRALYLCALWFVVRVILLESVLP